jgi:hypothetical protein
MSRNFINLVRDPKSTGDDFDEELMDDGIPNVPVPVTLPMPDMGNLDEIDKIVQHSVMSQTGRDSLVSFISDQVNYLLLEKYAYPFFFLEIFI